MSRMSDLSLLPNDFRFLSCTHYSSCVIAFPASDLRSQPDIHRQGLSENETIRKLGLREPGSRVLITTHTRSQTLTLFGIYCFSRRMYMGITTNSRYAIDSGIESPNLCNTSSSRIVQKNISMINMINIFSPPRVLRQISSKRIS